MKKTIKILIFSLLMLLVFGITEVKAASASIKASKTKATVGDSVTITVTIKAATWNVSVSGSGISDKIVGYNEDAENETKTKKYTLNTSKAGTYTVSISGDVTDENETKINPSDSVTVTVSEPVAAPEPKPETQKPVQNNTSSSSSSNTTKTEVKKSSDSKLKALSVEGYQISPEFSADVKEYTLNVPYEVTKLNISASVNHSKATYSVTGEEELAVGKNEVIVKGRAEDGSTTKYTIIVTRAREELHINSIIAKITDENGVITELPLNPVFSFDILEYTLEQISYKIEKIDIEALANLEGATVEITGNENLQEGENIITITARIPKENVAEGETETEEVKVYTIKVNKEAEPVVVPPTMMGTIKNFFNDNNDKIIAGTLVFCAVAFAGLTIYLAVDYNKYKILTEKIAKLTQLNNQEIVEVKNVETEEIVEEVREVEKEKKVGRHF